MARALHLALLAAIFILTTSAYDLDPRVTKTDTSDSSDCSDTLHSLLSCLPAVEGDDPEAPTKECCTAVVHVNADCLCSALGEGDTAGFPGMNIGAALLLPRKCGRVVPKGFKCAGHLVPSP
ncbi:protein MpLTP-like69 [Marchantia polymorpha subsp. ruderalis]|uniref:Bifunctional inhibitor/plant lipid transfer protein/seed storage helical domain-containing protein n=2 Tax=Marchantia polymorpha TaxID=3197 RepID=A0AAF6B7W6_MARPO|nr:hypothetical protein MARPO_0188s0009 [Marchantia polymorpha]BBN08100.1 hypothetical protein Mp_4g08870 [Marchantia polymorpha subsp. ruderalis]|eukprot:PTQ27663.1 hypothetical protein MARPO_0188s0009 [Marchantia polymorpha]